MLLQFFECCKTVKLICKNDLTRDYCWGQSYKTFTAVIYGFFKNKLVFFPGKPFQSSLMFVGKIRGLAPERGFTQVGSGLTRKH